MALEKQAVPPGDDCRRDVGEAFRLPWDEGTRPLRVYFVPFQFLCQFPQSNIYIFSSIGKAMFAERKVLSSESI